MAVKSFTEFFDKVDKLFKNNATAYQQSLTTELGGEIAKFTPVDTGAATANWQGSINGPNLNPTPLRDTSFSAEPTKRRIYKAINYSKFGQDLYLANSVRSKDGKGGYIIQLEEGKSQQARNGMVLINLTRLSELSKRALAKA